MPFSNRLSKTPSSRLRPSKPLNTLMKVIET
jgi:hypothetical protein